MESFLAALDLTDKPVLLLGNSEEAALRLRNLARAGARVTLVAAAPESELLRALAETSGSVVHEKRAPLTSDLEGVWLAIVADRNPGWVDTFGPEAHARRIFFCAVDQPVHNSFAHVGIARAGKLQLGISTSGAVPGIAGALKRLLQDLLDRSDFEAVVSRFEGIRRETPEAERPKLLRALSSKIRLDGKFWLDE